MELKGEHGGNNDLPDSEAVKKLGEMLAEVA